MHPDHFEPLTHAELMRLENFLRSHASGDWAMSLSGAHGFLTAAVSGPEAFEPGESIRLIFDEPVFADGEQAAEILGLILRLQADIERSLPESGRFRPLLEFVAGGGGRPSQCAGAWCRGYLSAMALWGAPLPGRITSLAGAAVPHRLAPGSGAAEPARRPLRRTLRPAAGGRGGGVPALAPTRLRKS